MTDRDPADQTPVAAAVRGVLLVSLDAASTADDQEAAAKALLDALLAQGSLRPEEHAEAFVESVDYDPEVPEDSAVVVSWCDAPIALAFGTDGALLSVQGDD